MKKFWLLFTSVLIIFILIFTLFEAFGIHVFSNAENMVDQANIGAAVISVGILASDIFLPIPSSFVMVTNGALFGVWVGTLLSVVGSLISSLVGFYIGSLGEKQVNRWMSEEEQLKGKQFFEKYGVVAIIISRPIPLLAETISIIAGTTSISHRQMIWSSFIGVVPSAIIYAMVGEYAFDFEGGLIAFIVVLVLAGIFWFVGKKLTNNVVNHK